MANPNLKKFTLTPRETRELPPKVLTILQEHIGAENPIVGKEIARQLGYRDDRKVRVAIRILREQMYLVAMSNGKNSGYFLAETREEWEAFLANIHSRAMQDLSLYRDCAKAMIRKWGIPFQPSLFEKETVRQMEIEHANL